MKVIGLDVGEKRIGVATADTGVKIASPHSTIHVDGTEQDQIKRIMADENTNYLVVGLPRNNQGVETAQSQIVRLFATELQARGARIKFQDESLTSVEAERRLKARRAPYRREDIDAEAATIILQDFIEVSGLRSRSPHDEPLRLENARSQAHFQGDSHRHSEASTEDPAEPRSTATRSVLNSRAKTPAGGFLPGEELRDEKRSSVVLKIILIVVFLGTSIFAIWFFGNTPAPSDSPLRQRFIVSDGQSTGDIADQLVRQGIIKDATVFTLAARLTNASIPAKAHFVPRNQTLWQTLDQLSD